MTAHAMAGDEQKSIEAGMNGHVTKPIDPDQLFAALQEWIKPDAERAAVQAPPAPDERPEPVQATMDAGELPESLPGFDLAAGLTRLGGNKKLYRKLLLDFGAKYTGVAAEIGEALEAKDLKHAHSLVHNLKGLAGNLEATELLSAAIEMEKLVKGASPEVSSEKQLNRKYMDLENAINYALQSVLTLGVPAEEKTSKLPDEEMSAIPAELAQDMAKRLRDAAEMGDVTTLNAVAEEIKNQSDSFVPLSKKIVQLAADFEFDGILKMVDKLDQS
jgi:HPt (histidine-containing phosphotransfer) domain-containing protein